MSDFKPTIFTNFINRRYGSVIQTIPTVNRLSLHKDIRQFTDTFDFDISYRLDDKIDLHSHDFVEFYFMLNGQKFQIGCGFVEDFVSETSPNGHHFQANGRDFLGHLFNIPFQEASPLKETTMLPFLNLCLKRTYLLEYLKFKKIPSSIVDNGAYKDLLIVPELTDAKIAPVVQSVTEEVFNVVYQNRFGQLVVWGRDGQVEIGGPGHSLNEVGDPNVMKFQLRENYSKVFSECKVFYTGGESGLDYKSSPSQPVANTEEKARIVFQPEIRTFQTSTLITTHGKIAIDDKKNKYAASILRKSNQNLTQVMISTSRPYFVTRELRQIPYEVNQLWSIISERHGINALMRLVAISYAQEAASLTVDLLFIGQDTLT